MTELDETGMEAALSTMWNAITLGGSHHRDIPYWRGVTKIVLTAYQLAAVARPTPDAEAMEQFDDALFALTEAAKAFALVEAPVDAGGASLEQGEAYCEAHKVLEQAEAQLTAIFRKAVQS